MKPTDSVDFFFPPPFHHEVDICGLSNLVQVFTFVAFCIVIDITLS